MEIIHVMTENDVVELPEMMVAEVEVLVAKEVPPIILARELEIETEKEIESVKKIERLVRIKTKIINVLAVRLLAVVYIIARQE